IFEEIVVVPREKEQGAKRSDLGERPVVHASRVCEEEALGAKAKATPILTSKPGERRRSAG
ncbi:unnamed protein product, partial [Ilex paraguariensis]